MTQTAHRADLGVPWQPLVVRYDQQYSPNTEKSWTVQGNPTFSLQPYTFEVELIIVVPLSHDLKTSWCLYWSLEAKYEHPPRQQSSHTGKKKEEKKTCWTVAAGKHMWNRQGDKQSGKHMYLIHSYSRQNIKSSKFMKYGIPNLSLFLDLTRNKSTRPILDSSLKCSYDKHNYVEFSSAT